MSWLAAALYDRFMRGSEQACLARWRGELLHDVAGEVLEVGAGTGSNVPHYPQAVTRLVLAEPDRHMRQRLQARCASLSLQSAEVYDASLGVLPIASESFDIAVSSLVLCSVPSLEAALAEIFRVLRPGGRFVFLEHVAAEGRPERLKWQRRIEPVWKRLAGNCHLTRDPAEIVWE